MRIAMAAWLTLALVLVGISIGRASDRDETVVTGQGQLGRPRSAGRLFLARRQRDRHGQARHRPLHVPLPSARPQGQDSAQRGRGTRALHGSSGKRVREPPYAGPQNVSSFRITSPTMLFGVDAPAVRPTTTGPDGGSQSARDLLGSRRPSHGAPTGRWRSSSGRQQALRLGDVIRPHRSRRRSAPGCRCCCCCSRPPRASDRAAAASSSAMTASCRSCVALQIVSNARKCAASPASP